MLDLISETKLGVTKGTEVEEAVEANFRGETAEVGLYLAMARQAQREGYPEVSIVLEAIAWDEARHASYFAELNGKISASTKENIERMLDGEQAANRGKWTTAQKAKALGIEGAELIFGVSSQDEGRHAWALKGLLDRYFTKK